MPKARHRKRSWTRWLPAVVLPAVVFIFQVNQQNANPLLILMSFVIGSLLTVFNNAGCGIISSVATFAAALLICFAAALQDTLPLETPHSSAPLPSNHSKHEQQDAELPKPVSNLRGAEHASLELNTFSVVLPCAYEDNFAVRTVDAIRQHTKSSRLLEIVVVDDGSPTPLSTLLTPEIVDKPPWAPVRLIRHEKTLGLIAAKTTGGNAAKGDIIVFFDCHVKPRDGWEEAFVTTMKNGGDHRTVVVPTITALNHDTWEEIHGGPASYACYMTWNADFTWLPHAGDDIPIMSGGLLGMTRRWWQETEGYDPKMIAWGGENLDQSLRTWLCGGRIKVARGAFVAHMWRHAEDPKTIQKYTMKSEDVMRNKARAVTGWMGEFANKTMLFPEYDEIVGGTNPLGDIGWYSNIQKKLKCAPFSAYIQYFDYIYLKSGLTPKEVYQIREESTGLCLERDALKKAPHPVILAPCGGDDPKLAPEVQLWHVANQNPNLPDEACCNGIANWNFLQCLSGFLESQITTGECDISGQAENQKFKLQDTDDGYSKFVWNDGAGCIVPEASEKQSKSDELGSCDVKVERIDDETFKLVGKGKCLAATENESDKIGESWALKFKPCDAQNSDQVFMAPQGRGLVKAGNSEECLDASGGSKVLVYPCYYKQVPENPNQMWTMRDNLMMWENGKTFCMASGRNGVQLKPLPSLSKNFELRTCASKVGQRFRRVDIPNTNNFQIRDLDSDKCLSVGSGNTLLLAPCDTHQWTIRGKQLARVEGNLCIDAADYKTPIAYPCHLDEVGMTQKFSITELGVQSEGGTADNGRMRIFPKCLDYKPESLTKVKVGKCHKVAKQIRWKRINVRTGTPESVLWEKAKTNPDLASIVLGAKK